MMCLFSISDLILQLPCKIVRNMIYILGFTSYIYIVFLCHVVFAQSTHVHDWRWFIQIWGMCTEKFRGSAQTLNRSPIYSRPCQDWGVDPNHHSFTNGTFIYLHDFHWFPCVFVCMAQHIDIVTRYCVYVQMFTKRVAQKQAISVYSAYLFPLHRCRYSCTMFYDNIVLC